MFNFSLAIHSINRLIHDILKFDKGQKISWVVSLVQAYPVKWKRKETESQRVGCDEKALRNETWCIFHV